MHTEIIKTLVPSDSFGIYLVQTQKAGRLVDCQSKLLRNFRWFREWFCKPIIGAIGGAYVLPVRHCQPFPP